MFKFLGIIWNSFLMALQELKMNKLRTFLSLFGVSIGIFCIIGIMAVIDSFNNFLQESLKSFTSNVIWIDKYDYEDGNNANVPYWKYNLRPSMKFKDAQFLKSINIQAANITFVTQGFANINYKDMTLENIGIFSVSEGFDAIQDFKISLGRYISEAEFERGAPCCVIGYTEAENLFGTAERAVGKQITIKGKKISIIGLIKKQGNMPFNNFDNNIVISYRFFASIFNSLYAGPNIIMVKAKDNVTRSALTEELRGNMRRLRRLTPKDEDNFALNDMNKYMTGLLNVLVGLLTKAGWAIAGLSLVVGAFGVANIMFVTVRERTSQIGLKKAIGAKSSTILIEFLLESAFLCLLGGMIGLLFVWLLTMALSAILPFHIFIALHIIIFAFSICIILGVLSGIIPAAIAAKMDPVVAIRK